MKNTVFVVAHNKRDFRHFVDKAHTSAEYNGERFVFVSGPHSLYGVNLDPNRLIFVDGWAGRDDAAELIKQVQVRTRVHKSILKELQ